MIRLVSTLIKKERKPDVKEGSPMGQLLFTDPICSCLHVIIWTSLQSVPEQNKVEMASVSYLC